jgi:hypothetical protein
VNRENGRRVPPDPPSPREGDKLDFKRDQHRFVGATDHDNAELFKDILAFVNTWNASNTDIVIGVEEENGEATAVIRAFHLRSWKPDGDRVW